MPANASTSSALKTLLSSVILASFAVSFVRGADAFKDTILVANRAEFKPTAFVDPHLINPWGIALRPPGAGGHIWVSNGGDLSTTTYIGDAKGVPLFQDGLKLVPIDGTVTSVEGFAIVTGQVYNAASDVEGQPVEFFVSGPASNLSKDKAEPVGTTSGAAKFVFVTTDGGINAWRANTATSMHTAVVVKDFSANGPDRDMKLPYLPAFTGVAMTTDPFTTDEAGKHVAHNRLYAADFQNKMIRVFDNQWKDITSTVTFERPKDMPADYSPFNIQWIEGRLYIAYAAVDTTAEEPGTDVPEAGAGHIVAYDRDGHILQEFKDLNVLNSPWGLALAPKGFGEFGGCLLVANFGDGSIAALDIATGRFKGHLRNAEGTPISIDGIWGLTFGNGVSLGDALSLYYTAGPNGEQDGLFGRLTFIDPQAPAPTQSGQ
jgi:uncharacterized protein (TIGR03118 family)